MYHNSNNNCYYYNNYNSNNSNNNNYNSNNSNNNNYNRKRDIKCESSANTEKKIRHLSASNSVEVCFFFMFKI